METKSYLIVLILDTCSLKCVFCKFVSNMHLIFWYYIRENVHLNKFLFNKPVALIIHIYSVINLYIFRASSLPIIRSFLLYIRHW